MRRIGSTPQQRGSTTGATCPDVIELNDGRFYVIGKAYPDAKARRALGALDDAGLLEQFREDGGN